MFSVPICLRESFRFAFPNSSNLKRCVLSTCAESSQVDCRSTKARRSSLRPCSLSVCITYFQRYSHHASTVRHSFQNSATPRAFMSVIVNILGNGPSYDLNARQKVRSHVKKYKCQRCKTDSRVKAESLRDHAKSHVVPRGILLHKAVHELGDQTLSPEQRFSPPGGHSTSRWESLHWCQARINGPRHSETIKTRQHIEQ